MSKEEIKVSLDKIQKFLQKGVSSLNNKDKNSASFMFNLVASEAGKLSDIISNQTDKEMEQVDEIETEEGKNDGNGNKQQEDSEEDKQT